MTRPPLSRHGIVPAVSAPPSSDASLPTVTTWWSTTNSGRDRARAIADEISGGHQVTAHVIGADLSQRDAAFRLVDEARERFGRIDVAISNSGVANVRVRRGEDAS